MAGTPLRRVHAKWHEVNIVVTQNKIVLNLKLRFISYI